MSKSSNLYTALAAAQAEMGRALKDSKNPHFKSTYADLASVMDACIPALTSNGIAVIQPTGEDEMGRFVKTVLIHGESGESAECRVPLIVAKNDMQGFGSAVTYARRYGLMSMALRQMMMMATPLQKARLRTRSLLARRNTRSTRPSKAYSMPPIWTNSGRSGPTFPSRCSTSKP